MNYYYYPLCSKEFTFENIFSSESVSPAKVYELRGFGADFFYVIPSFHHPETIVLYNKPPQYSISDPNYEVLKFVLKISEDALQSERLIFISEGIVGYTGTIYLNNDNFELLFFSEKELTITCLRSETSLLTKSYKKYMNNFKIIHESDCVQFDTHMIVQIKADPADLEETVSFDRLFNSFKGFCYGLAVGLQRSLSNKETVLKRGLQDITNNFAEFKSRASHDSKKMSIRAGIKKAESNADRESSSKVFASIEKVEQLFREISPGESYSEADLEKYVHEELSKYKIPIEDIKQFLKFKKMEDLLLGTNTLSKIKGAYLKKNPTNPVLLFEMLRECLSTYSRGIHSNADWVKISQEKANDSFKQTIFELSKIASAQVAKANPPIRLNFSGISYIALNNEIQVDSSFQDLGKTTHHEYVIVLNTVLRQTKRIKGDAQKEGILKIVESVASRLNKDITGKNTNLYQYLNGDINEYDPSKLHSIVMKNFVAFVFNPDSLEKLENYLNAKEVDSKWMAYSFWCSFNGFTNISRNFVASFFEELNRENISYLNHFISDCFLSGASISMEKESASVTKPVAPEIISIGNSREEQTHLFFEKYVSGKFNLSLEQFRSVIQMNDRDAMVDELKKRHRISKKDGVKLIDHFKDTIKIPSLF